MTMYMYLAAKMFALISVVVAVSAATDRASSLRRRLDTPTSAPTTFDDYLGQCEPALWVDGRAYFNTLSALQQCAVARVGYTEEGWDTDQEPILDSCNAAWICNNRNLNEHDTGEPKNQRELVDTTYDDMEWADLVSVDGCQNLQEQFQLLGVTEGSWNDFYECYTWGELGGTMQQYSRDLGYNRTVWNNGCDTPPCVATEGKAWADLTDLEQAAAEAFGYGCFTWDGYPDPAQNWWMDITCAD